MIWSTLENRNEKSSWEKIWNDKRQKNKAEDVRELVKDVVADIIFLFFTLFLFVLWALTLFLGGGNWELGIVDVDVDVDVSWGLMI